MKQKLWLILVLLSSFPWRKLWRNNSLTLNPTIIFPTLLQSENPGGGIYMGDLVRLVVYWLSVCGDCEGADLTVDADGTVNLKD